MNRFILAAVVAAFVAGPLEAQDERHLKQLFEGRRVTLLIDMPASQEGVDIFPGSSRPLDFQKYSGRLKKHGVAIREGDRDLITKIRVKDDLIEVHLGGGGYGTFGDVFNSAISNNGADSGAAQQLRISNERAQRLAGGSRFNLRFPNGITPDDLEPEAIVAALAEYVTFPPTVTAKAGGKAGPSAAEKAPVAEPVAEVVQVSAPGAAPAPAAAPAVLKKGMLEADVEAIAGKATASSTNGPVTTKKYRWQEAVLEADYVNGVMVAYRVSSGD